MNDALKQAMSNANIDAIPASYRKIAEDLFEKGWDANIAYVKEHEPAFSAIHAIEARHAR